MKEWRNQKTHFCSILSRTHPNSHTVNVYCYWLLLTEREIVMLRVLLNSTFTVQILYSLQLNCTYSNYTEAAATCSAAQVEAESRCCLLTCSTAGCLVLYVYIRNHIQRSDPWNKFEWLKTQCHNLTAIRNTRPISCHATARRRAWATDPLGWDDVIQECGVIGPDFGCKLLNTHEHLQCDAAHPHKAPFSAMYLPVRTATEPCHLQ